MNEAEKDDVKDEITRRLPVRLGLLFAGGVVAAGVWWLFLGSG